MRTTELNRPHARVGKERVVVQRARRAARADAEPAVWQWCARETEPAVLEVLREASRAVLIKVVAREKRDRSDVRERTRRRRPAAVQAVAIAVLTVAIAVLTVAIAALAVRAGRGPEERVAGRTFVHPIEHVQRNGRAAAAAAAAAP